MNTKKLKKKKIHDHCITAPLVGPPIFLDIIVFRGISFKVESLSRTYFVQQICVLNTREEICPETTNDEKKYMHFVVFISCNNRTKYPSAKFCKMLQISRLNCVDPEFCTHTVINDLQRVYNRRTIEVALTSTHNVTRKRRKFIQDHVSSTIT